MPNERKDSALVQVAKYSEIGFLIPAAVILGYIVGRLLEHWLHRHWIVIVCVVFGAVAGFVSMIRMAIRSTSEEKQG